MAYLAFILVAIKILADFSIFVIKKINCHSSEQLNSDEASCIFCQMKDNEYVCTHFIFKRNMNENTCPRQKCWGFNTGKSKIDNDTALVNIPWLLSIKKAIDLFPELSAALLALNEIISK